jgi:hypothetical protein
VGITEAIYFLFRAFLTPRLMLAAENLALRQQVSVYKRSVKRPKLRPRDRIFWVLLSRSGLTDEPRYVPHRPSTAIDASQPARILPAVLPFGGDSPG